jgi:hypothetical protein
VLLSISVLMPAKTDWRAQIVPADPCLMIGIDQNLAMLQTRHVFRTTRPMPNTSSCTMAKMCLQCPSRSFGIPLIASLLHIILYDRHTVWIFKETTSAVEQNATENNWTWEKWKYFACISRNSVICIVHQILLGFLGEGSYDLHDGSLETRQP